MVSATRTIAFVVYDGLTPLDMVGPLQVLNGLASFSADFKVMVVAENVEPLTTDTPLRVMASHTLADAPEPAVVVVPGGGLPTIRAMANPALRDYLRAAAEKAEVVASVCTGALILAAAGLLEGRRATTHWAYSTFLERLGATYVPERWVQDGKFLTAAGVSAGIDMGLYLAGRLAGEEVARRIQLGIEYDPQPPYGGIEWAGVDRAALQRNIRGLDEALAGAPELLARMKGESLPA